TIIVGAETGQALLNAQLYYAFLRGAGKQYGVLWYGNASVWNRKGYKNYYEGDQILKTDEGFQGYTVGPDQGTSLMLLKRLLYVHYLHNCAHAGFEMGWILGDSWEKRIDGRPIPLEKDSSTCVLTPIGEMQAAGIRFVKKYGKPGVMYAPICLMLDFYAGWRPPRHCYTRKLYQVWGNIPYSSGDHLTHGIFSLLYPGYEDSSYYPNEKGFLSSTPYGDAAEVLLTDAEESVLSFYSTVIISGEVEPSEELKVKLENFVRNGGRLVITAGNLLKFADGLAGLKATKETVSFPAGTLVLFGKEEVREDLAFQLHKTITGADQEIIVRCGKTPAVVKRKFGTGEILLCLSSFGISPYSALPGRKISIDGGTPETPLPNPFPLLAHVKHLLDALFKEERIFEVGEGLGYVTCRKGPGNYTIGIYNNGFKELPFRIKSLSGKMVSIKELPIDCSEKGKRGYWPTGFEDTDTGKNTEKTIAGGDIRIFRVTIKEKEIEEAAPLKRMNCPRDRYLSLRAIISIKEEMLNRPTFFRHFSGVKVGWDYFRDKDPVTVAAENQWLRMQKVDIIVDFSEGLNFYPDLTILDNIKWRYKDSLEKLLSVFDKMAAAGAGNAVFSLHRMPENHFTKEQTSAGFLKNVKTICKEAADRDITIHLQSHPNRWYSTTEEMLSFISEVAAPNLKFVLNLCHLLMSQSDLKSEFRKVRDICSVVLVSVPGKDSLSQTYDAHLPVTGSLFEKAIRDFLSLTNKKAIALDAEYSSGDDEFKDIRMVEVCTSSKANT
ncbi:MAG: TIM barrel protein, partial [Candidatus Omnitrophota bacterium]